MAARFSLSDSIAERQKLTTEQSREIERLYKDLAKKAAKEAEKLKSSTRSGRLRAIELGKLEKKLQGEADKIGAILESSIPSAMKKAAAGVVSDATAFNEKMGLDIKGAYSHVPTDIVETLVSGKLYKGKWSLSKSIWADVAKTQADISKVVAEGIALNKSSYDIAKDLEMYVDPSAKKPWDWSKVYPGTKKKIDYNAQRLARTMVGHAYQQSVMATCKDDPFVDGIEWISGHTSSSCELCEKRDGKIFPADQLPLDHPNGKCSFAPAVSKSLTQISDELADWVQGKPNPEMDKWYDSIRGVSRTKTRTFSDLDKKLHKQWAKESPINMDRGSPEYIALYGDGKTPGYVDGNSKLVNSLLAGFEYNNKSLTADENARIRKSINWENLGEQIKNLDKAISRGKLPRDSKLYRVIDDKTMKGVFGVTHRTNPEKIFDSVVGNTYTQSSFMSTSLGIDPVFKKYPCVMTLETPGGTPAVVTTNYKEGEILLGRNTRYEVVGVVDHRNDPMKVPSVGNSKGDFTEYYGLELICRIVEG